jgi:hypothetical protein
VNSEPQTDPLGKNTRANRTSNAVFLEAKRPLAEIWILCRIFRLNWIELGGPMSKQAIQKAVVEQLRQSQRPMSVRELVERIRRDRPEFKQVADFDFRSAVLAMRTSGAIESTSTNQVAVRTDQPVPARG